MDEDDPRRPLLGDGRPSAARRLTAELCSVESWRRRLPITIWLPKYTWECLIRDAIAGITVGLTSIPQGIAYAMLAGLPPQVGLYSSIFPGFVYALFGSCKDVTVGPTAILAALLAKYVALSPDFAYLATFLSGCVILLLGVLQLGFLLDFISKPVISGFTTAAALQISASQLKSLFRVTGGGSGGTFISALVNFFKNIKTVHLWDTVLGVSCIVVLLLLKCAAPSPPGAAPSLRARALLHVVRARNALVVFAAALLAYILAVRDIVPFALTGKIEGGLPQFGPPPFSTVVKNSTLSFEEMLAAFGPEGLVMPLVAILESIAIAKAFAGSAPVDATQEMVALGAVNVLSAFCQSMPSTGSFTRSALNHASGVLTPAGSIFKASLVLIAVTLLSSAFAYIPRAALAAVIVVAMASLVQCDIVPTLWYHTKLELCVYCATVAAGACAGLEYGILCGAGLDAARELARAARPNLHLQRLKVGNQDCSVVSIMGPLSYACASRVSRGLAAGGGVLVLDGRHAGHIDLGVAENIALHVAERSRRGARCLLWNFPARHRRLLERLQPALAAAFVHGASIDQHVLGLDLIR